MTMSMLHLWSIGWACVLGAASGPTATPASTTEQASATPDVVETLPEGSINWSHHLWRVRGQSLPVSPALSFGGPIRQAGGALALARTDAQTRLVALRRAMFWGQPLQDGAAYDDAEAILSAVTSRFGEGRAIATQFFSDGHVTFTQDFAWDRPMAEAMWQARQLVHERASAQTRAAPASHAAPSGVLARIPTGLVVNARGLAVRPSLLPEVHNESGDVLFGIRDLHPEALSRHGVARFSHSLDAAVKDERMGSHPAVVRAHALHPQAPWIVVVDARQAAIVEAARPALAQGRVIIVMDEWDGQRGVEPRGQTAGDTEANP